MKSPLLNLTLPGKTKVRTMKKFEPSLNVLASEVLQCTYGQYPWDDWERDALAAGVPKDLAGLGRLTVREAYNHDWGDDLKSLCGWYDQGKTMIKLALRSPKKARAQWELLLDTDGLRGDYHPKTKEWTWGYLRRDAQRLLATLTR